MKILIADDADNRAIIELTLARAGHAVGMGSDDSLAKPFHHKALAARVQALFRRMDVRDEGEGRAA